VSDAPTPAVKLSHGLPVAAHADTHTGHVRANNEDAHGRAWLKDGSLLAVVCDGMGGHQAGEVASGIAVQTLIDEIGKRADEVPQQVLFDALLSANEAIIAEAKAAGRKGMGTTAVTAIVRGHEAYVGLVGDSRLYHVRAGKVLVRTRDHTRVEARLQAGEITEDEARDHPESGVLTRALGHRKMSNRQPLEPEVFAEPVQMAPGDALVLSTDGLHDLVEDWEIASIVADADPQTSVQQLIELALARGGHDNVTVMVVIAGDKATGTVGSRPAAMPASDAHEDPTGPTLGLDLPPRTRPPGSASAGVTGSGPTDQDLAMLAASVGGVLLLCGAGLVLGLALGG